ncbi:unnamed protein product [Prunus brigantina]
MKTTSSYLILLVTTCCYESVVLPSGERVKYHYLLISGGIKISTGDSGWGVGFTDCTRRFLYRSILLMFRPLP